MHAYTHCWTTRARTWDLEVNSFPLCRLSYGPIIISILNIVRNEKCARKKCGGTRRDVSHETIEGQLSYLRSFLYFPEMSPNTMTIATYNLTFSDFFINLLLGQSGNQFHNIFMLFTTDVVKVHYIVWIKLPTVPTRRFLL
jgi:hypothetical protein